MQIEMLNAKAGGIPILGLRLRLQSMCHLTTHKPNLSLEFEFQGPKIDPSLRACSGHDGREIIWRRHL